MNGPRAALVLVATPIGNLGDLSSRAVEALRDADVVAAEDTRRTRRLLSAAGVPASGRLRAVHAHNERREAAALVELVRAGRRVVYVSDAGMPGISDPGARLVSACVEAGLPVELVPGPSAVLAALVLSGLPADRFRFEGFLPRRGRARAERLAAIAAAPTTVVVFESPHRVAVTLAELAELTGTDRPAAVVRELTKLHEEVVRGALGELADLAAVHEPRGEHVLVVGPPVHDVTEITDDEVDDAVARELAAGSSARDAAATVAGDLGIGRRRAYESALRQRVVGE